MFMFFCSFTLHSKLMTKLFHFLVFFVWSISLFANNSRYRLILTDNPATTIMIGWDQISGVNPIVYFDTEDHGTDWSAYTFSKEVDRQIEYKGMDNHFAKLKDLLPETNYFFIIKDSEGVSESFWFKTAPATNKPMSFIAGGDSRNNRLPRQYANKIVSKLKPTAVFFGGDMTSFDSDSQWEEWFDDWQLTIASDGRMFPIIPTRGNHEFSNETIYNLFNIPSSDCYYDITFGENLYTIYTLNTEIFCGGYQYAWLKNKLQTNKSIWKSAQYHRGMRPHVSHKPEGTEQYQYWSQLFYENEVRLIFESDAHDVKTTWAVKPCTAGATCEEGFIRDDIFGSVYMGEGCWGAPLREANDNKIWTRNSGSFNQFKWICVSNSEIKIKTILVEDPSGVLENLNSNSCNLPEGINVWNPSNGDTVTINKYESDTSQLIITNPQDGDTVLNSKKINIKVDTSNIEESIILMIFKSDNNIIGLVEESPFEITHQFDEGNHSIEVIAYHSAEIYYKNAIQINSVACEGTPIIKSVTEDVEESETGSLYTTSSDLELVYDSYNSQGIQKIGLYFEGMCIPKDAIIESAYIQFTADKTDDEEIELLVYAELAPDALSYNENQLFDVSNRNYTNSIYWKPKAWQSNESGINQRTPDLKSQIQEIINLSNWKMGNAMAFKIEGITKSLKNKTIIRKAKSKEGNAAPQLIINYTQEDAIENPSFVVYPNPANDILYFVFPTKEPINWKVALYDLAGKKVLQKRIIDNQTSVKGVAKGNYVLKVYNEINASFYTRKIGIR